MTHWLARLVALDDEPGPLIVACSGGADSLALLVLLRAASYDVSAVYVDHGLRAGTEHEATVVVDAAARFGARAVVRRIELTSGSNLEARARDARYAVLRDVADEVGAATIAVGHTRDDQAETVLLNLLRGSGLTGLAGMAPRHGRVIRPLLRLRRADTIDVCARAGLAPVHDPMNDEGHFRRVWLRREILPRLVQGARRDLVDVLARQAELMRDDDAALDDAARAAVALGETLDAAELVAAGPARARRAVRLWLGNRPVSADHVEGVLAVARGDGRAVELPNGVRIERAGGRLHRITNDSRSEDVLDVPLALPGHAAFGRYTVDAWIEHAPPVAWPDGRLTAVLDADRVDGDVLVRAPRPGERFRPAGSHGSKAVLGALAEAGVPASVRPSRPVVAAQNGDVCWVVGYRVDERVKVTAHTRRYLWISLVKAAPE